MRIEIELIRQDHDRWAARLSDGRVLSTELLNPRTEVARLLLATGFDSQAQMVLRIGDKVIARDTIGSAMGTPVLCDNDAVAERDEVNTPAKVFSMLT